MIGGTELFLLVVGCDLALGPLLSLVVYDSRKRRRELLTDYTVIGLIQIAALVYGVMIVASARPAYLAYSKDRYEVVSAGDLRASELEAARDPQYRELPWTGVRYVAVVVPPEEQNDALFEALNGNEEILRPKFYVPLESQLDAIRSHARPLAQLAQTHPEAKPLLDEALTGIDVPADRLAWLPVRHLWGFWTAIIDTETGKPVAYVAVDPY
jgi:hypothetical protein